LSGKESKKITQDVEPSRIRGRTRRVSFDESLNDKMKSTSRPIVMTDYEKALDLHEAAKKELNAIQRKVFGRYLSNSERLELKNAFIAEMEALDSRDFSKLFEATNARNLLDEEIAGRQFTDRENYELYYAAMQELTAEKKVNSEIGNINSEPIL
jgi:hypothetical protein